MSDLLRPLLDAIETVRKRIQAPESKGWNEAQTRASLIDPVLTALGWNTADPSLVRHEHQAAGGRADYALLSRNGKLAAIIEAKPLGHSLDTREINQTTHYANNLGAKFAALADGLRWQLYDVFKPVPLDEKKVIDISLSQGEPEAVALTLLALWRPNASSGDWRKPEPPRIAPNGPDPPPQPVPDEDWIPLDELESTNHPPPAVLRFEDGTERRPETWRDVLAGTITWLHGRHALTEQMMPFMMRKGSKPQIHLQQQANTLKEPKPVPGTPFAFGTHLSAQRVLAITTRLFQKCGRSPSSVLARRRP